MNNTTPKPPMNKADAITGFLIFFGGIGITAWLDIENIWPVNKLIDLQAGMFDGSYYPKMTFMITLLCVLLPLMGIRWLVKKIMKK